MTPLLFMASGVQAFRFDLNRNVAYLAMVWSPGRIKAGQRFKELVSLMDFGPTILDFANVAVPEWMEAQSFQGLLLGDDYTARERIFSEHSDDLILTETNFMTMVREGALKLVHFIDSDEGQFFDLASDPDETNNLWHDAGYAPTKQRLIHEILRWRIDSARKTQGFVHMLADR